MKRIRTGDESFKTFSDILTGYRQTSIMMTAHSAGVFDEIGASGSTCEMICQKTGWSRIYGRRFLDVLCSMGFLDFDDSIYTLTGFAERFLFSRSDDYQGSALEFERTLVESWNCLSDTLDSGSRVFGTDVKTNEDYASALALYLDAMNDAAIVRASEVWDSLAIDTSGLILDAGAGSGRFLFEFLNRNKGWTGIFCDLKDVIDIAVKRPELISVGDRLNYISCDLTHPESVRSKIKSLSADIIFMSNVVHCQGDSETELLLSGLVESLSESGRVIIHDFFKDCGWRGASYDLHMMLNTFNGKTYSVNEIISVMDRLGMMHVESHQLSSGSTVLVFKRT